MVKKVLRQRSAKDRTRDEAATPEMEAAERIRDSVGNAALARLPADSPAAAMLLLPGGAHVSNAAVARSLSTTGGSPEQAADRVADVIAREPVTVTPDRNGYAADLARQTATPTAVTTARSPAASGGEPLPATERSFFGPRLGYDLSRVRVHADADAAGQADVLRARAFTVGTDIYLGRGEPRTGTAAGRHLLAHELTHVVQQQSGLAVQRQEIPDELRSTPNYRDATDDELQQRHDWIISVLDQFTRSTPDTALLEQQAAEIGTELARRRALAAGRTFTDEDVQHSRSYFVRNAREQKDSCIVALNKGLKLATGDSALPTTPQSIEATMAKVAASGHAEEAHEIWFQARSGQITRGVARPDKLDESVWKAVLELSEGDPGWSVFTMSLLDGYHSVTLTLDATDPAKPRIYWSDQWQSKGGWKEYSRTELDTEVTKLVQEWWDAQEEGKKHTTVVRLWRIRAKAPTSSQP